MKIHSATVFPGLVICTAGCMKSDPGITTRMRAQLASDVNSRNIRNMKVETTNLVMALTGEIANQQGEAKTVEIARSTHGLANAVRVDDNLIVHQRQRP